MLHGGKTAPRVKWLIRDPQSHKASPNSTPKATGKKTYTAREQAWPIHEAADVSDIYFVDCIVRHINRKNIIQYIIRGNGYNPADYTAKPTKKYTRALYPSLLNNQKMSTSHNASTSERQNTKAYRKWKKRKRETEDKHGALSKSDKRLMQTTRQAKNNRQTNKVIVMKLAHDECICKQSLRLRQFKSPLRTDLSAVNRDGCWTLVPHLHFMSHFGDA